MPDFTSRRFAVEISDEQYKSLSLLDHGMRKQLFTVILDDLLSLFDRYSPGAVIGALIERSISLKEICKLNLKE